jgi:hypothetical protein
LLRLLAVINPYADQLTFLDHQTRTRRDHEKYLTLIDAIALLHQYQRPVQRVRREGQEIEYIEVTLDDIALANRLAHEVLGRTLDELPPQTRRLLTLIQGWVRATCDAQQIRPADLRFSRKQVRALSGWGHTQLKLHLARLVEMEHVRLHRLGQAFEYELLYDGDPSQPQTHLNGLIDVAALRHAYDADRSGSNTPRPGSGRPLAGGASAGGRDSDIGTPPKQDAASAQTAADDSQQARFRPGANPVSYPRLALSDT